MNEESGFNAVRYPMLLEAMDVAQLEKGSPLNESNLQMIEAVEDMEQNSITGIAYYYCKNVWFFIKYILKHIYHH